MSTGDTVQFKLVNQRVDKKDLVDMQALPLDALVRALGGLLGLTSGALSQVPVTFDSGTSTLTIGACTLFWSNTGLEGTDLVTTPNRGGVVLHDPDRPAQNGNSTVDLTGLPSGRLFFQRRTADADYDNRAHYPSPGSGEQVATTATRSREWVAFAATDTTDDVLYNASEGWYHFANFEVIGGGVNVFPLSAFGDVRSQQSGSLHGVRGALWQSDPAVGDLGSTPTDWGLVTLLQNLIVKVLEHEDGDVTFDNITRKVTSNPNSTSWWVSNGSRRGLRQLDADLATAETDIDNLQTSTTDIRTDFVSYFRDYLANQPQVLASYNAYNLGEVGEGGMKTEMFLGLAVTTSDTHPNRSFLFTLQPLVTPFIYGGTITAGQYQILAVRAVPLHSANWTDPGDGRVPEVQVFSDSGGTTPLALPYTTTGTNFYARLRFRKISDDDDIEEPDYGFYFEVIGRPVFS